MEFQPVFIVGVPRSGTTLLRRLLDRHPLLCVPPETHFIPQQYRPFLKDFKNGEIERALALITQHPRIVSWNVQLDASDIDARTGHEAYAQAITILFAERAAREGKRYWADKTPSYTRCIPLLNALFPRARFVHVVRDERDVAISLQPLAWGPNNAYASARHWNGTLKMWKKMEKSLGERAMILNYERLIRDPQSQLRQVCDFVGLPYSDNMATGYGIDAGNHSKWQNIFHMSKQELIAFESQAGDMLGAMGYERGVVNPRYALWRQLFAIFDDWYKRGSNRVLRQDS